LEKSIDKTHPHVIITIDGPAGAGKSTLAKGLSRILGIMFLDSGATYRAAALFAIENNIDLDDPETCGSAICDAVIDLKPSDESGVTVLLNGRDITKVIRSDKVAESASRISVHTPVRRALVSLQRKIAEGIDIVAEGRDMGSIVFPNADLKFYLDSPVDERAFRRKTELKGMGEEISMDEAKVSIIHRDERDMTRLDSPLVRPPDSIYLNNGNLNKEETLKLALKVIHELLGLSPLKSV
jgi:cytidylate kinase